ncbi:MAG TPA: hypothetical protein VFE24_13580 [Pirellulales bacterium]|jgi:hypothetical protein|nr:hypothetical protein [Pirellulales bacterium]
MTAHSAAEHNSTTDTHRADFFRRLKNFVDESAAVDAQVDRAADYRNLLHAVATGREPSSLAEIQSRLVRAGRTFDRLQADCQRFAENLVTMAGVRQIVEAIQQTEPQVNAAAATANRWRLAVNKLRYQIAGDREARAIRRPVERADEANPSPQAADDDNTLDLSVAEFESTRRDAMFDEATAPRNQNIDAAARLLKDILPIDGIDPAEFAVEIPEKIVLFRPATFGFYRIPHDPEFPEIEPQPTAAELLTMPGMQPEQVCKMLGLVSPDGRPEVYKVEIERDFPGFYTGREDWRDPRCAAMAKEKRKAEARRQREAEETKEQLERDSRERQAAESAAEAQRLKDLRTVEQLHDDGVSLEQIARMHRISIAVVHDELRRASAAAAKVRQEAVQREIADRAARLERLGREIDKTGA